MTNPLTIRLFGPPDVQVRGASLPRMKTRKGLWILALLALRHEREVARDWLAGTLWPDAQESRALTYLRQTLTELRHALGPEAGRLVSPSHRTLRLDTAGTDVDVVTFDESIRRGDTASLERAVALYRGPLLEGCAEEWVLLEREERALAYLQALETLAQQALAVGDAPAAVHRLRLVVAADPLRESAACLLMQALAATRDFSAVTEVYRELRLTLRREMGAEPDSSTRTLFDTLRREARRHAGTTTRADVRPVLSPSLASLRRLPRPLSTFIGREQEIEVARRDLAASRIVTLTGMGGVGKTRMAICVAEAAADDFPDGACFVDLSALSDPALVPKAIAAVLDVPEQPGPPLAEALGARLRDRHLLLILDNCEHLLLACARIAGNLLAACPHLRVLATSRQRLGLTGERERQVPPLALPYLEGVPVPDEHLAGALLASESVRLFVDRARQVQPDLPLDGATLRTIARICRRLDGIPLALELAAARMRALGPEQVADRLDERFRLLAGGDPTAPPRQQTLRATLDWSHDLLPQGERTLLRRLSVFAGGWTLEAAEAICSGEEIEDGEVLNLLTGLAERSLVIAEPTGEGAFRYRLLETVRHYGREKLARSGEEAILRARHAQFFLALAERAGPELKGPAQAEWLQRLEEEHNDLRAALECFLARGAVEDGLRLGGVLGWFWWVRGYLSEGRERLEALLALAKCGVPTDQSASTRHYQMAQAQVLIVAGMLADDQNDYAAARALFQESLALSRELDDQPGIAFSLGCLGGLAVRARDYPVARALYEESVALARAMGDPGATAAALTHLGRLALLEGEYEAARGLVESGLAIQRQLQDRRAIARSLTALGSIAARLGDLEAAQVLYQESLALARELGARGVIEETLRVLGTVARERGDHDAAVAFHEEQLALAREAGSALGAAESLYYLGQLACDRGEGSRAATLVSESLAIYRRLGDKQGIAGSLQILGNLACEQGDYAGARVLFQQSLKLSKERGDRAGPADANALHGLAAALLGQAQACKAARLWGGVQAWRQSAGESLSPPEQQEYDRRLTRARSDLGEDAFAAAWAEGSALTLAQIVEYALEAMDEAPQQEG